MLVSEKRLIRRLRTIAPRGRGVLVGIGDDAAVLHIPSGHEVLVTTDFTLENVHFRRDWHAPDVVGWRCLTRGLSDIAAMGGEPVGAFLSLAVAANVPQRWVDQFFRGLMALAAKHKVPLAGGDTAQSRTGIQADIVVVGSVPRGKAVLRSGAKPGDSIYVTGALGGSAFALDRLRKGERLGVERSPHFLPEPRLSVGRRLRELRIASALIDISDGLSTDLQHICEESRVGAELQAEAIPRALAGRGKTRVALEFALHGGDDYELLFTSSRPVPPRLGGVPITRIGQIRRGAGMRLSMAGVTRSLKAGGWEHFRRA